MKTKQKIEVRKEREVNTYVLLWDTSKYLFGKGIEDEKGSFYQFKASIIFMAFTLEAYLNHIGEKLFTNWKHIERKLGPQEKLNDS